MDKFCRVRRRLPDLADIRVLRLQNLPRNLLTVFTIRAQDSYASAAGPLGIQQLSQKIRLHVLLVVVSPWNYSLISGCLNAVNEPALVLWELKKSRRSPYEDPIS